MKSRLLLACLLAPAPQFLLTSIVFVWTGEQSVADTLTSIGVALGLSYGVLLVAGLPAHFGLRAAGHTSIAAYAGTAIGVIALLTVLTGLMTAGGPPLPNDDGPLAGGEIFDAWMVGVITMIAAPFAVIASVLFWMIEVRPRAT